MNKKSMRTRSIEGIEGIEERGEGEEEDPKMSYKSNTMSGMINSNTSNRITASNMNLMKSQLDGETSMDDQKCLTAVECKYLVSVLKNRSV